MIPLVRAQCGLDPFLERSYDPGRSSELLLALQAEGVGEDKDPRRAPLGVLLDAMSEGSMSSAVLIDAKDHLYMVIGMVESKGRVLYQLIHGQSPVSLLSRAEILGAGFREAWVLENKRGNVPVSVGSGTLKLDGIFRNLGLIRPGERVTGMFVIENAGNVALEIGKPTTSCGCTTTRLLEGRELQPGETLRIPVELEASNVASVRQTVEFRVVDRASDASRVISFSLFGNEIRSMRVGPRALDFGTVLPGISYTRSVTLEEVPTDRFTVRGIDAGGLPLTHAIEEAKDGEGLRTYRVALTTLKVGEDRSGRQLGEVVIATDSRFFPEVVESVIFDAAPYVQAVPSVVALGEIPIHQPRQERVRVVSRSGVPVTVEIVDAPAEAAIRSDGGLGSELIVTVTLGRPGVWKGVIRGKARAGSREVLIDIPCVAYGVKK